MKTATICILLMLLFQMCSPAVMGLATEGKIIKVEPDRVFVLFEEQMGKPGRFTGSWFYFPGLGLIDEHDYYVKVSLVKKHTAPGRSGMVIHIPNPAQP